MLSTLMLNCLVASRNSQRLAFDQSGSHFFVRTRQNVTQRLPRNAHFFRGIGLIKVFDVSQSHRLKLIERQSNLLQKAHRHALWLKVAYRNITGYPATDNWSSHQFSTPPAKKSISLARNWHMPLTTAYWSALLGSSDLLLRRDKHRGELQRDVLANTRQAHLRPAQLIVYRFGETR